MAASWFGEPQGFDCSRGVAVWHPDDYLALIRKQRGWGRRRLREIEGIDYLPYENVLPWERKFRREYEALPNAGPVSLSGELLKEARSWGLPEAWGDKADFVRACQARRRDRFAINGRRQNLCRVIERLQKELRTAANYKTVDAFVAQNRKEVDADTNELLRFASRGGRPLWEAERECGAKPPVSFRRGPSHGQPTWLEAALAAETRGRPGAAPRGDAPSGRGTLLCCCLPPPRKRPQRRSWKTLQGA